MKSPFIISANATKAEIVEHVKKIEIFTNNMFNDYIIPLSNELYAEYSRHKNAYSLTQKTLKKTGIIDCGRVFAYKTSDNIFKRKAILPKGKNHGIVLAIDNSASMAGVYHEVLANAAAIALFCKRSSVKLKCFSFTAHVYSGDGDIRANFYKETEVIDTSIDTRISTLQEIFNEQMSLDDVRSIYYEAMLFLTLPLSFNYIRREGDIITNLISLGIVENESQLNEFLIKWHQQGTPLALANIACLQLAEEMKLNDVEHVTIITLTDGDNNCRLSDFNRTLEMVYRNGSATKISYNGESYTLKDYEFYENAMFKECRMKYKKYNHKSGFETGYSAQVYLVNDIISKNRHNIHQINIGDCTWMDRLYANYLKDYRKTGIFHAKGILGFTSVTCLDLLIGQESTEAMVKIRKRNVRKYFAKNVVSYVCNTYK